MNFLRLQSTSGLRSLLLRRQSTPLRLALSTQRAASTNVNKSLPSQGVTKEQNLTSDSTPKPKLNTNLRKAAAASLPIREKSTRGAIRPVITLSTAEKYALRPLLSVLKSSNATMFAEALWLPVVRVPGQRKTQISDDEGDDNELGEAFIFENGCAVFWGIQEDDARQVLNNLVRKSGVELGRYAEEETEELEFVTDPSE